MSLREIAEALGARLELPASWAQAEAISISGVSSCRRALAGNLVFAVDQSALDAALASAATAVIVAPDLAVRQPSRPSKPLLLVAEPRLAFAQAAKLLRNQSGGVAQIHPSAIIGAGAEIGREVSIGAYVVIGARCRIGAGTAIGAGCVLGDGVVVGSQTKIYPRVVLYSGVVLGDRVVVHAGAVLGADGFGYVRNPATGAYVQFPQQGRLVIEDDVEIGANTTIDRGALEETRILSGTKIDNLVHIGHNVLVGRNVVMAAQTGISGSCSIGDGAVLGGQVGMGDHASVGEGVILGGQAGVLPFKKLEGPGAAFWGTPAQPLKRYLKQLAFLARLLEPARSKEPEDSGNR